LSPPKNGAKSNPKIIKQTREKVFREIESKLFETKIDNTQLTSFLNKHKFQHAEAFAYDYISDKNLTNLRYCIFLLTEEVLTILDNLAHLDIKPDGTVEDKVAKRNKIIEYLLKEKIATSALMSKVIGVMTDCNADSGEVKRVLEKSKAKLTFRSDRLRGQRQVY